MILALAVGGAGAVHAQTTGRGADGAEPADPDDPLTVFLVTAEPGDAIWERFGHNGLWIHDARTGEDVLWEWGLFSFRQENFILRLIRGTMLYGMGGRYLQPMLDVYSSQNRSVWAQELALTPEQEQELDRLVRTNARPENAQYAYHYYRDNCSTRARDALDSVLDGQLREAFRDLPGNATWRWHTRRLLRPDPLAEAGLQVVLGNPGDQEITAWEAMFLPMQMRRHLASAEVVVDGESRPLVVREVPLLESTRGAPASAPANRWAGSLLLGLALGGGILVLGMWSRRGLALGKTAGVRALGLGVVAWCLVAGALGWILVLAWAFTDHDFWRWNENLVQTSPLLLPGLVLAFPLLMGKTAGAGLRKLLWGVAYLAVIGVALKVLPGFDQSNWEIVATATPVHLALAWAVGRLPTTTP
ncbi:MAG: DUF4105 domain-containing protein [Gemmatimonadales bacterium]|nr:MAG: DUF4105 domain-containing protein [Gemmatimonadales bacterium]